LEAHYGNDLGPDKPTTLRAQHARTFASHRNSAPT
jgi:hypothetical protein